MKRIDTTCIYNQLLLTYAHNYNEFAHSYNWLKRFDYKEGDVLLKVLVSKLEESLSEIEAFYNDMINTLLKDYE